MENLDADGEWWLPDAPDRKVPGRLTFSVEDGGQLRLIGTFSDGLFGKASTGEGAAGDSPDRNDDGRYPRILGQVANNPFTLEGCHKSHVRRNLFGGLPSEAIHVGQIYRGVWYENGEAACGDRIAVRLAHLVYWIRLEALDLAVLGRQVGDRRLMGGSPPRALCRRRVL